MKDADRLMVRKILFAGKLALGLVLCVLVARTVLAGWTEGGFAPAEALGMDTVNSSAMPSLPSLSIAEYAKIVERNPFINSARTTMAADSSGFSQSVSKQLGLELLGTVTGQAALARAVIKDTKTDSIDLYRTGQVVSGASIMGIEKEHIILLHNGERKILKIETSSTVQPAGDNNSRFDEGAFEEQISLLDTEGETGSVDTYRTRLGRIESILRKAKIRPYVADGEVQGLKLGGLDKISAARDFGLRDGDVIQIINGQRLTSKQKAYQIFLKARTQPVINLELLRGEKKRKVSFVLR